MSKHIYSGQARYKIILLLEDTLEELKGKHHRVCDFNAAYDQLERAIREMNLWLSTAPPISKEKL